jgi:hypothetical protein
METSGSALRAPWGGGPVTVPALPTRRLRESTWLAFAATTVALVLLASIGTAVLVHFGTSGSFVVPPREIAPVASGPLLQGPASPAPVPVDRVIGSFHQPAVGDGTAPHRPSLGELLTPPQVSLPKPQPSEPQPVLPLGLPTAFPTALPTVFPTTQPSPVQLPLPVPVPDPITVDLPGPLPDVVLLPGGLIGTSPSPLPHL